MELTNTTDSCETFEAFCKQLCESCSIVRHLGRDSREFDARPTSINHSWRVYGTSRAQMAEKRCALCRQIRSLAPEVDFIDFVRLSLVEDAVKSVICQGQRTDVFDGLSISVFVLRNSEDPHFDRHFILVCSSLEGFLPVGHFDPGAVDFKLVRSWIESCEAGHSDTCTIAKAYPVHGFQVMDCATGTVVPMLETSTKYAALSYVWGEPKSDEITFPKTVRDAMTAVLALGIRFLWVDRYVSLGGW